MRKLTLTALSILALAACDKRDPILPGDRTAIFADTNALRILNEDVATLPNEISNTPAPCKYTQDSNNVVWDGNRKIFSGFPTSNSVKSTQNPVCSGKYVYAGLTTGELVKINPQNRNIAWIADIYRASNMTGGASVVDIVAPIIVTGDAVYVGGLGDAFCKINATSGAKKWCIEIGVAVPFIVAPDVSYVVATDNNLYAIRNNDGAVYWHAPVRHQVAPVYDNGRITVGRTKINAKTGTVIKK